MQEVEDLDHSRQRKIQRAQSENRKHIGGVDNERLARHRQNRRDGVGRKQHVGSLHHNQHHRQRRCVSHQPTSDEKFAALKILRHKEKFAKAAEHQVRFGIDLFVLLAKQFETAVDEDRAEDINEPVKAVQQRDARDDEDGTHDQRAQDAPEQHVVLKVSRDAKIAEDEQKNEEVIDAKGLLDEVSRNELQRQLGVGPRASAHHGAVSYTHLRAHETVLDLVCRLLLVKKKTQK